MWSSGYFATVPVFLEPEQVCTGFCPFYWNFHLLLMDSVSTFKLSMDPKWNIKGDKKKGTMYKTENLLVGTYKPDYEDKMKDASMGCAVCIFLGLIISFC